MCLNDTRSSASTSSHSPDRKQGERFEPARSPSLVGALRHANMTSSVRRMAGVAGDLSWRLNDHMLVQEVLCVDCISQGSGVPFIKLFSFVDACIREGDGGGNVT